ncbi:hypothetical protein R3P38DRAFT_2809362 [Favolaschia claudopus]|uniref:F-box domain-containing protein n=1 Tax=Favolaschia claudopus TaxID=2862362 RepID=A0AAV9ZDS1_9AGAR
MTSRRGWTSGGWGPGWASDPPESEPLAPAKPSLSKEMNSPLFPAGGPHPGIVKRLASSQSDSHRGGFFFESMGEWMSDAGKYQRAICSTRSWLEKESARVAVRAAFVDYIISATLFEARSIQRVPPEIWHLIFKMAYGERIIHWSPDTVLYTPMSVCRNWRDIIAGGAAGGLWSPIDFRGISPTKCRARAAQLGYALNRGPLTVSVSMDDVDPMISGSLHRLVNRELDLTLNIHDFYSTSFRARLGRTVFRVQYPVPNVSTLAIEGGTFWTGEYPCRDVLPSWAEILTAEQAVCRWVWPVSSSLKSLTFLWTMTPEICFTFPWGQIESYAELNTARINGSLPSSHLQNMSNLRVLCLSGVWLPSAGTQPVSLLRLEELSFVVPWSDVPIEGHFAGIHVPELRVLRLRGRHTRSPSEEQAAHNFHGNLEVFLTQCPLLTTLSVALQIPYSGRAIAQHMAASPNLLSLYILAANRDMFDLDFVQGIADLSISPFLQTLVVQQGRYWDGESEESVREKDVSSRFVQAIKRRFEHGLKILSMPENGGRPYADVSTRHELWELSTSWNWVDDRWGVGGVKISSALRERLLALGTLLNVTVDLDTPFQ